MSVLRGSDSKRKLSRRLPNTSTFAPHDEQDTVYEMKAKSAIMIHYPRAAACLYTKERRSSRRAWVQEKLNMIHYPRAAARLFTSLRAEESKVGGSMISLAITTKWQPRAPSWSTTLGLWNVYIPKSEGVQEELEVKKSSTWSTILKLRHVYLPVCGRKSQVTSSKHIVVPSREKPYEMVIYL